MSKENANKRQKIDSMSSSALKICVHSGGFHADEALGYFLLKLLPKFKDAALVRSREPEQWEASDIVIDVSGKYDGKKFFDHHQRGFTETFNENFQTKLSSAGLVYKHFGKDIIKEVLKLDEESKIELLYLKIYGDFIEALDANDNGIDAYDETIKPKFSGKNITLPAAVSSFNPDWNDERVTDETYYNQFLLASDFIGNTFLRLLKSLGNSWLPAKDIVEEAFKNRFEVDESGKILVLSRFSPWKEHLYEIEKKNNASGEILYVLFPESHLDENSKWRISTVPITSGSFNNRKPLPEEWRGLRDEELSEKSGVPGCVFIHAAGFIGGAKTKSSVLKLAKLSL